MTVELPGLSVPETSVPGVSGSESLAKSRARNENGTGWSGSSPDTWKRYSPVYGTVYSKSVLSGWFVRYPETPVHRLVGPWIDHALRLPSKVVGRLSR